LPLFLFLLLSHVLFFFSVPFPSSLLRFNTFSTSASPRRFDKWKYFQSKFLIFAGDTNFVQHICHCVGFNKDRLPPCMFYSVITQQKRCIFHYSKIVTVCNRRLALKSFFQTDCAYVFLMICTINEDYFSSTEMNVRSWYCKGARCWWRSWMRHCATSWKVAGTIPDGVTRIFY
jgi:hypothetical protein